MNNNTLPGRWNSLLEALEREIKHPIEREGEVLGTILEHYLENTRHYHGLDHISYGLDILDRAGARLEVKLAWWFHDVIYDAGSKTNEIDSVMFAVTALKIMGIEDEVLGNGISLQVEVTRLILITIEHRLEFPDINGEYMILVDLYGLASTRDVYEANTAKIRKEFEQFTDEEWRVGRLSFLEDRLSRQTFPDRPEYRELNSRAYWNMAQEKEELLCQTPE